MKSLTIKNYIIAITALIVFAGCTTYKPPSRPQEELAHIKETKIGKTFISIKSIDDVDVESFVDSAGLNLFKKDAWVKTADDVYDIEPGPRVIGVMLERGNGYAHGKILFIAEAGKTYRVMGNVGEREGGFWTGVQKVHFFIEDDVTGENVSDELVEEI